MLLLLLLLVRRLKAESITFSPRDSGLKVTSVWKVQRGEEEERRRLRAERTKDEERRKGGGGGEAG